MMSIRHCRGQFSNPQLQRTIPEQSYSETKAARKALEFGAGGKEKL
jgi:hypothetical protein